MTPKRLALLTLLSFGLAACGRSGKMNRNQQNYDVVHEGSANGVTSTINAPGETPPPLTATNIDTTTAFTLPQTESGMPTDTQQPGTIAGSLPTTTAPNYGYATPPPRPRPVPHPVRPVPEPTPQPQPQPAPQPTETAAPPPPTDTTATATDTVAPPTATTGTTKTDTTSTTKTDTTKTDTQPQAPPVAPPPAPPPPTDTIGTQG